MIRKSHTIHSHCRKAGNLVQLTDDEPMICHHWYFLVSLQFPKILFQMVNHPKMNTTGIFYVVFFFTFFEPLGLLDVVLIVRD